MTRPEAPFTPKEFSQLSKKEMAEMFCPKKTRTWQFKGQPGSQDYCEFRGFSLSVQNGRLGGKGLLLKHDDHGKPRGTVTLILDEQTSEYLQKGFMTLCEVMFDSPDTPGEDSIAIQLLPDGRRVKSADVLYQGKFMLPIEMDKPNPKEPGTFWPPSWNFIPLHMVLDENRQVTVGPNTIIENLEQEPYNCLLLNKSMIVPEVIVEIISVKNSKGLLRLETLVRRIVVGESVRPDIKRRIPVVDENANTNQSTNSNSPEVGEKRKTITSTSDGAEQHPQSPEKKEKKKKKVALAGGMFASDQI